VIDEHLETVLGASGEPDSSGRLRTGLSLLMLSVAYLAWFALSAVLGPVCIAFLRPGREMADEAWTSGDDL
jgi:hypothetical protein